MLPNLSLPETKEYVIGKYGHLRLRYLKQHRPIIYTNLLTSCKLSEHLAEVEKECTERMDSLVKAMAKQEGVTEALKAAEVVRRIFRLTIDGHGPYEIARILFDDKVETPAVYFAKRGIGIWKSKEEFTHPYSWSGYIVGNIIAKQEYCGDTVNFRSHKESYKDKSPVKNPKEDWLIFKDTHEAIVDRETWELAQKLRKTPKRIDTFGVANPFTGLVYCADCGAKMFNHRSRGNKEKGNYPADFFDCSAYTLGHQKYVKECKSHYIRSAVLRTLVLETIKAAC